MTNPSRSARSRWVRPTSFFALLSALAAVVVWGFWFILGPWASLLFSFPTMALGFWVTRRATLYPLIYRSRVLAAAGLLVSFMGFNHAAGRLAYDWLWRRSFQLNGREGVFQHETQGWSVAYPGKWQSYQQTLFGTTSVFFKPTRLTPNMEFSVIRRPLAELRAPGAAGPLIRPLDEDGDVESVARSFLLKLPANYRAHLTERRPVAYPGGKKAYEIVYEDPLQAISLRHRLILLLDGSSVTLLSVAAVPGWFERLADDSDRFLFSFRPSA